jgi:glutamate racemase
MSDMDLKLTDRPLGVFDSGVGGLTVTRAIRELLPNEDVIYLGDTARLPYGSKSPDIIRRFALEDTQYLISKGVKAIVVACNTATAHALEVLQETYRLPIVGVLEPGVQATLANGSSKRVGVIGTNGTIQSQAYQAALKRLRPELEIYAVATPLLVPFIEENWLDHEGLKLVLQTYLKPLQKAQIDTLVLGCTHYPLLKSVLTEILGEEVRLIDSASCCADAVATVLKDQDLLALNSREATIQIHFTDLSQQAQTLASHLMCREKIVFKKAVL